jgi:voltage-gated potassium channel
MSTVFRRAGFFALLVVGLIAFGTVGFVWIEAYPWFDALYMTVITLTTVGYYEVRTLSMAGRIFNMVLLLVGVNLILLGIGMMTSTIFELQLDNYFSRRRSKRMINSLSRHFIICGYGRVGRGAAVELLRNKVPFVIVDDNEDKVEEIMKAGMLAVLADCTRDETLRGVQIDRATGLIAALATDADNLFLTLSAKTLNPKLIVAARANEEEADAKLRRAGANSVFSPYGFTGSRLAQSILRPHVTQFLDYATLDPANDWSIEQLRVEEDSEFSRRSLRDLPSLRKEYGVSVLAVRRGTGEMIFNPGPELIIGTGDHLIVMGKSESLKQVEDIVFAKRK